MRHPEGLSVDDLLPEEQRVYVHRARRLLPFPVPPQGHFDPLTESQLLHRRKVALDLGDAVQVIRLLFLYLDRPRLVYP